ncbi:MAG: leucyl/phenylalanyl-tRNA--protein transferase [Myxococcota bacterium]
MTVYRLTEAVAFPDPREADPSGLLAVGGDLEPTRLLVAYASGIFPWYDEPPILWFSPEPRAALRPAELHVPRRLRRTLRSGRFELRLDTAFREVVEACAGAPRSDSGGTWITPEMAAAYTRLHELGFAHSAEAWREGELVGGTYGVSVGSAFAAESMFHRERDAGNVALVALIEQLAAWQFTLFDAQLPTDHLARFVISGWSRDRYLAALAEAIESETRRGIWRFERQGET